MAAAKYDFAIEQGTSFRLSLVYKNAEGIPVDLTGWCARLVWRTSSSTTQTFSSNNNNHEVYRFEIDEPNGKLTLLFPTSTTNSFNFNTAKYDLELQSPDDLYDGGGKYSTRILYGIITIVKRFSQIPSNMDCSL
ncbi:hypothetical protein EBZ38_11455 [bacterium]|nr:hypothetical protein [bacterium]NDC95098.1 hypothetical protein [bacterium]NDD84868.1 hypothetical protein [bacterium]